MRHVTLTCKNHPNLRWTCKSIAFTPGHGYNTQRNIFFHGAIDPKNPDADAEQILRDDVGMLTILIEECSCPASDLILAPGETMPDDD